MKHYKDPAGNLYGLTFEQVEEGYVSKLPPGCREITDLELSSSLEALRVASVTPESVRAERDAKLAQTDWTQLGDVSVNTRDLWAPYRQALRDITEQGGFPTSVIWPTPPKV